MRKPVHSTESSIEEILASIRSIIAEDGTEPRSSGQMQGRRPAARSDENLENTPTAEELGNLPEYSNIPFDDERQAAKTTESGDEILELTEDFMLAELAREGKTFGNEDITADPPSNDAFSQNQSVEPGYAPMPEKGELDEVLSNLAAEVGRLNISDTCQTEPSQEDLTAEQPVEDKENAGQLQLPKEDMTAFGAPSFDKPDSQTAGHPQIAGIAEPKPTMPPVTRTSSASTYERPPATPAPKPKPVWSARRLETPVKPAPPAPEKESATAQNNQEQSAPSAPPAAEPSQSSPVSRRDLWAEGVQMPVPDTGPEIPLPMSEDHSEMEANQEDAPQEENASAKADRLTVGSFLTRVFGSAPAPASEDELTEDDNDLHAKAEKLARVTISDFAEEKLNAPSVGDALKADEEFMNEVTASLANALASTNGEEEAGLPEDARLPEAALPADAKPPEASLSVDANPPQAASIREPIFEMHPDAKSGWKLDVKVKKHLTTDMQVSEETTADLKKEDQDAPSAETASAEPIFEIHPDVKSGWRLDVKVKKPLTTDTQTSEEATADKAVHIPQDQHTASAIAETGQSDSAGSEVALTEAGPTAKPEQTAAELPQETAVARKEQQADNAAGQSTPALNLPPSLEGSIKEMIKPLIIQWLNDNMARIVEEAVREELTDRTDMSEISNKSRA